MTQEQDNVARLKDTVDAWHASKGASTDRWLALFTDDIDFRSLANGAASLAFTTHRSNKAGVVDYLANLTKQFDMIEYVDDEFIAEGNRVVAVGHCSFRNRETGGVFDTPKIDVCTFRDGKISAFHEYYDTLAIMQPEAKPFAPRVIAPGERMSIQSLTTADARKANVDILRKGYESWRDSKGMNVDAWTLIMADNIRFQSVAAGGAALPFSRSRQGVDEARGYLTEVTRDWTMIDFRMNEFIADRDYVVAVGSCHWTAKRNGIRVDTPKVDIWRMRDGRAVQFFEIFDTHAAFTAATSP